LSRQRIPPLKPPAENVGRPDITISWGTFVQV